MAWFEKTDARSLTERLQSTDAEIQQHCDKYMRKVAALEKDFKEKTKLNGVDMTFLFLAAALQVLRWSLITNSDFRFENDTAPNKIFKNVAEATEGYVPPTITDILLNHRVPYDVVERSARFKAIYPEFSTGVSGANHRYTTLGHDPLVGLIVGTANIATDTLCVNKILSFDPIPSYHVRASEIDAKTDIGHIMKWTSNRLTEEPEVVGVSFLKQIVHAGSDVFTTQGLPLPIINSVSPEASKWLIGNHIDLYSVTRGVALAMLINKIVEMTHKLFCDPQRDDPRLYEAKTLKVIMYSNILSSVLNVGYVAATRDFNRLDVGGIAVALFKLLTTPDKIREIKMEFIDKVLSNEYKKQEDEINQQLARFGYHI